jgi:hypothetical protein
VIAYQLQAFRTTEQADRIAERYLPAGTPGRGRFLLVIVSDPDGKRDVRYSRHETASDAQATAKRAHG